MAAIESRLLARTPGSGSIRRSSKVASRPPAASSQKRVAGETEESVFAAVDLPWIPPRYRTSYFAHIWSGGYSAGYYAYIWSEVLDADAYDWFVEHGGLTRANGQRFRDMILARGGTGDMATIYREFRGRDPEVGALLRNRGLAGAPR